MPSSIRNVYRALAYYIILACVVATAQAQYIPAAPLIAAKSWLLVDVTSGQRLTAKDPDQRIEPASLTKLMTAYVVFAALRDKRLTLDQAVPVPVDIYRRVNQRAESVMFIPPGKSAVVQDLLRGMIVQSGNDASIVLAEAVAGTENAFADLMNREARRLGMNGTSYRNATGMPDAEHYSTANDLAILVTRLIADFPDYYKLYSEKEFIYNGIRQTNRNRLLWTDPSVDGVKTGFTDGAGYCLIASARRSQANGGERRLLSVVLGTASMDARAQESLKLLNWGFQNFDTVKLYDANQPVATPEIWKGSASQIKLGFRKAIHVTVPRGQSGKLKPMLERKEPLVAPIASGTPVGKLRILIDDKLVVEHQVVALETVKATGIFGRAWDSIRLLFM